MNQVRMQLLVGEHTIDAHVARTREQRALGLMHRTEMAPNEGMLFICGECAVQSFWMKDTPLPLSIAFLDEDGTILHVDDMEPHSLDSCTYGQPVRHILEMPRGWFAERGIGPGDRVEGPAFVATASATSS
jgi:uncharacterized membrane protein (UPF0127 family)